MRAIHRKLMRDLWGLRGPGLAIALVIASGVATLVMSLTTYDSLDHTRNRFYSEFRFSEIFADLKRAPRALSRQIEQIKGVDAVCDRVLAMSTIEVAGFTDPIIGQMVSIPNQGEADLNKLWLSSGEYPQEFSSHEVLVSDAFAEAHDLIVGSEVAIVINGKRQNLSISGIALTPEYTYQVAPGSIIPDYKRYGIFWMRREALAVAYDMEGAFNNVVLSLQSGVSTQSVIEQLDLLLEHYGGLGAYARKDQISHSYLNNEFEQLKQMAKMFPTIFLSVAAFLLNVVLSRLVSTQREQIAALKAFGYSNFQVGMHFMQLVSVIAVIGAVLGVYVGYELGQGMGVTYRQFYRFPYLDFELNIGITLIGICVPVGAAMLGTFFAVRKAALLPPAEAMRPEPPANFKTSLIERLGLQKWLAQPTRMILRNLGRRPLRTGLSILGISMAYAILVVGSFFADAMDALVQIQYGLGEREDVRVQFTEPASRKAYHELMAMEGVLAGEPYRVVPVRFRFEHRSYLSAISGYEDHPDLHRVLDEEHQAVSIPSGGLYLTNALADIIGAKTGDLIRIEVLEGSRSKIEMPLAGTINQYIGLSGYMRLPELNRMLREGPLISGVHLAAEESRLDAICTSLKKRPRVASIVLQKESIRSFFEIMAQQMLIFAFINTILAGTIAFGVVYNSARITLSERSRELASLRVLGFTRGEISYILIGELAILTVFSVPLGCLLGYGLSYSFMGAMPKEIMRIPLVINTSTFAFSIVVVFVSTILTSLLIRRKLHKLDLVSVLKSKE